MSNGKQQYQYPLSYDMRLENPPVTREQLESSDRVGCDAIIVLILVYPPDGSFGVLVESLDGRTGEEVSDGEIFKVWVMLASRLANSGTLSENQRSLAEALFETVRQTIAPHGH